MLWKVLLDQLHLYPVKRAHQAAYEKFSKVLSGRVLDVGSGRKPFELPDEVKRYITIDYAVDAVRKPCVQSDAMKLPFIAESFSGIICTEVLEHLPYPEDCVTEIARVLDDGGVAYITAPMTWPLHYEPQDFRRFTKYGLKLMCDDAGLVVEEIEPIGSGVFSASYALCTETLVTLAYKLGKPLQYVVGNKLRVRIVSVLLAPAVLLGDLICRGLDRLIPSCINTAWALIARKPKGAE